jgi:uncharacterized glyoxalase superfamily protein PhnB
MLTNRSIPACSVIPELPYRSVTAAAEWLSGAFGFSVRLLIADHRIQMNVNGCAIVLVAAGDGEPLPTGRVLVRVERIDEHHERATQFGAYVLHPPTTYPFGERQYSALDLAGHRWTFSESVADVAPEDWGGTTVDIQPA